MTGTTKIWREKGIPATVVVVTAKKVVDTRQKTRTLTFSSGMSRGTGGGNGAFYKPLGSFLKERVLQKDNKLMMDKNVTPVRTSTDEDQHNKISKAIEVQEK